MLEINLQFRLESRAAAEVELDALIAFESDAFSEAGGVVDLEGPAEVAQAAMEVRDAHEAWVLALSEAVAQADEYPLRNPWSEESPHRLASLEAVRCFRAAARRVLDSPR